MKYTISLGGRGAECFLFKLDENQVDELLEMGIEDDEMSIDEISNYLGVESIFCEDTVLGVYQNEYYITISDDQGNVVWNSDDTNVNPDEIKDIFEDSEWNNGGFENEHYLVIEDYSKGEFLLFELECDEFDIKKLKPIISEVAECKDFIVGLYYDDKQLDCDFGDYWSKGFYFTVYRNEFI